VLKQIMSHEHRDGASYANPKVNLNLVDYTTGVAWSTQNYKL